MPGLGQNKGFLGFAGQFKAPRPDLQVPNWETHLLQGTTAGKWVIQGRRPPKKLCHFFAKHKA